MTSCSQNRRATKLRYTLMDPSRGPVDLAREKDHRTNFPGSQVAPTSLHRQDHPPPEAIAPRLSSAEGPAMEIAVEAGQRPRLTGLLGPGFLTTVTYQGPSPTNRARCSRSSGSPFWVMDKLALGRHRPEGETVGLTEKQPSPSIKPESQALIPKAPGSRSRGWRGDEARGRTSALLYPSTQR